MIPSRAGQVWRLLKSVGTGVNKPEQLVLMIDVRVPSWGPGFEQGVHVARYLDTPESECLLEESFLTKCERVL